MNETHRPIRSFVLRQGRVSNAQRRAHDTLLPQFGIRHEPFSDTGRGAALARIKTAMIEKKITQACRKAQNRAYNPRNPGLRPF